VRFSLSQGETGPNPLRDLGAGPQVVVWRSPPGEAESGSAGVQPDKEYPGRRCADGASAPGGSSRRGPFRIIGHQSHALKNPPSNPLALGPFGRVSRPCLRLSLCLLVVTAIKGRLATYWGLSEEVHEDLGA
jgi:hypothetical protein